MARYRIAGLRSGQMTWPFVILLMAAVMMFALTALAAGLKVRNERAAELRARELEITQYSRAESTASGYAAGQITNVAVLGLGSHTGWDDPAQSEWSDWRNADNDPCVLDESAVCWQVRLGQTEAQVRRDAAVQHEERPAFLRVISGCPDSPTSGFSRVVGGVTVPFANPPDLQEDTMLGLCDSVAVSQTMYRKRSFLQYGLHVAEQELSPRQPNQGSNEAHLDSTMDLRGPDPTDPADDVPFHTNASEILVCTRGVQPGWPKMGSKAEVVTSATPGTEIDPVKPAFRESNRPACRGGTMGQVLAPVPTGNEEITVRSSRELLVAVAADEPDAEARCSTASPSLPHWMRDAVGLASQGRPGLIVSPGGTFDLSAASDGDVIFSGGHMTVTGSPPAGSSVSVAASGSISIARPATGVLGPGTTSGVLALIVGCDVLISDPYGPQNAAGTLDPASHGLTLQRTAILAPHGAFWPVAYSRYPTTAGTFPVVAVDGAIATGYLGGFAIHDAAGQSGGYDLTLSYPSGTNPLREEVPPWWPDPLGGPWQPIS